MKVVFWCDMEGTGGITSWAQVTGGNPQYDEGRRLYTGEVNAAVRGAKRAGAKEIIVVDGHGAGADYTFNSLLKDLLEPGAEYVFGHRWSCHVEPFTSGCAALLMPGAHAMAGTPDGVLSHTISSASWHNCWVNGRLVGETVLMAAIAGSFGVPAVYASGDAALSREIAALLGGKVAFAQVKKGLGRFAAQCLAPDDARALIEEKVLEVLSSPRSWPKPYKIPGPVELKVELATSDKTQDFVGKKGVDVIDSRTVVSRGKTLWQAWDQFWKH